MSLVKVTDTYDLEVANSCWCVPVHRCFKNKSTQFPETREGFQNLRALDLIRIPRPFFQLVRTVRDVQVQCDLKVEEEAKGGTLVVREVATSVGGLEQGEEEEQDSLLELEEVIKKYLPKVPRPYIRPGKKPAEWPKPLNRL